MNLSTLCGLSTRFFTIVLFFIGFGFGQAQTDSRCYDATNAGTVGETGWTGCEGMYIVADLAELEAAVDNDSYKITHDETDYTFGDSTHNIFTGQVTSLAGLFLNKGNFNADIGYWDTSNATGMGSMFYQATSFNQDIGDWDTSNVTNMAGMFLSATSFNQDLSDWNVATISSKPVDFDTDATSWTNQDWRPVWGLGGIRPTVTNTKYGSLAFNSNNHVEWSTKFSEEMALPSVAEFLATKALRVGTSTNIVTQDSGELLSIRYGETDGQEDRRILIFEVEVESGHESYLIRMQYNDTDHDNSGLTDLAGNAYEGTDVYDGFVDTTNLSVAALGKQGVLVYPNPVHAQLHLVYPSATPATYTVYDLTGKAHFTHHASGQTHQLSVSSLAKGVYLLKAQHGNQTGVFRFVKE